MADLLFPPAVRVSRARWEPISNSAVSRSIFTGAVRSLSRTGDRWRVALSTLSATDRENYALRANLKALRAELRGQTNRIWLMDTSYRPRGVFPTSELLGDSTFLTGTTGWSASAPSAISLSAGERRLRVTRLDAVTTTSVRKTAALTAVAFAPYAARALTLAGRGAHAMAVRLGSTAGSNDIANSGQVSSPGMLIAAGVPLTTGPFFNLLSGPGSLGIARDYFEVPFVSVSRCLLVDNPSNLLKRSEQLQDVSGWTLTRVTVTPNSIAAPDGSVTADSIIEDNSGSTTHFLTQTIIVPSPAADFAFAIALKAGTRSWARLVMIETTGSEALAAYFDLTNGVVGNTTTGGGSNWSDIRTTMFALGDGWYYCCIVGRKANAATGIQCQIRMATGDNGQTYTGDNTSLIYGFRATAAQSSFPIRLTQSTSAVVTDTVQSAAGIYVKGLPANTSDLLKPGDRVQGGTQLNMVTSPLHSDAAGMGFLQCAVPWRGGLVAGSPIIVHNPMGRFILTDSQGGWDDSPGGVSDFDFSFEEALDL